MDGCFTGGWVGFVLRYVAISWAIAFSTDSSGDDMQTKREGGGSMGWRPATQQNAMKGMVSEMCA